MKPAMHRIKITFLVIAITASLSVAALAKFTIERKGHNLVVTYDSDFGPQRNADPLPDFEAIIRAIVEELTGEKLTRRFETRELSVGFSGKDGAPFDHYQQVTELPRFFLLAAVLELDPEDLARSIQDALDRATNGNHAPQELQPQPVAQVGRTGLTIFTAWMTALVARFGSGRRM
jgi:hypothetical protein